MCEYCSCRTQPAIAQLGEEHEVIQAIAVRLQRAHEGGDTAAAAAIATEMVDVLLPHVRREEVGLFAVLDDFGAEAATDTLRDDHTALDALFTAVAAGDPSAAVWDAIPAALLRLDRHICREEYDVFPAAIQLLDDAAWDRVDQHCDVEPQPAL